MRRYPPTRPALQGFTAIEIAAVAAIIAILTLIMVPIVRNRVAESKIVAAQDDMHTIEKAQSMAFGYTDFYFRLFDLVRPESNQDPTLTADQRDREWRKLPPATWNRIVPFQSGPYQRLVENWKGPFMSVQNSLTVREMFNAGFDYLFRFNDGTGVGGPILLYVDGTWDEGVNNEWLRNSADALDRLPYPVDPWGNPYLFFGAGEANPPNDIVSRFPDGEEVDYSTALVVSLGPDGLPGNPDGKPANYETDPVTYYRESGILGEPGSDDLVREF